MKRDPWILYCEAFRECFPTAGVKVELSPAALDQFYRKVMQTECATPEVGPIPAGMVLVPEELTAENGMKFQLSGDFSFRPYEGKDLEFIVPWDTIKQIHRRVVELSKRTPMNNGESC